MALTFFKFKPKALGMAANFSQSGSPSSASDGYPVGGNHRQLICTCAVTSAENLVCPAGYEFAAADAAYVSLSMR